MFLFFVFQAKNIIRCIITGYGDAQVLSATMDGATDGGTDGTIIEGGAGGGSLEEDTLLILDLDKCLNMLSGDFLILFWLLHLDDEVDDADDIPKKK